MKDLGINKIFIDRLSQKEVENLLTFPEEKLILATRQHPMPVVVVLSQIFFITLTSAILTSGASLYIFKDLLFSISVYLTVFLIGMGLILRELVNWYFHIYIVTTKRVTEVRYSPLFSETSNSVLLDQLRCTEIDADLQGFIPELFNLGSVVITFDRPTHQEEFILKGIRAPRKVADQLSAQLHSEKTNNIEAQHVWLRGVPVHYGGLQN